LRGLIQRSVRKAAISLTLMGERRAWSCISAARPCRWKASSAPCAGQRYNPMADAYQGEVEAKRKVESAFLKRLETYGNASDARAAFPEPASIWEAIFTAFEHSAEVAERKLHGRVHEI
jgi:hypothetical protein